MSDEYVSPTKYAKAKKLNVETVKQMCKEGKLEYFITKGGHYKIKIYDGEYVSKKEYEKVKDENLKLSTTLKNLKKMLEVV